MRILFDQGTPVPLRKLLSSHQMETFKNLRAQQNFAGLKIAIVVLSSTSWPRIQKAAAAIKQAVDAALPASFKEVSIP